MTSIATYVNKKLAYTRVLNRGSFTKIAHEMCLIYMHCAKESIDICSITPNNRYRHFQAINRKQMRSQVVLIVSDGGSD